MSMVREISTYPVRLLQLLLQRQPSYHRGHWMRLRRPLLQPRSSRSHLQLQ